MKRENQLRLARLASNNVWSGGASALVLAKRITKLHPMSEAEEIVGRVYASSHGRASHQCPECGQEYVKQSDALDCCNPIEDEEEE